MADIYRLHEAAFSSVSAFVILKDGERVATVAFKFPKDGAGHLYCYAHVMGIPMVRAFAGGYGYDKRSAAAESAFAKINPPADKADIATTHADALRTALSGNDGYDWDRRIRDAGYEVLQAV
jgi:hypothetical protein